MPTFTFTDPSGKTHDVTGPPGSTPEQAFGILQQQLAPSAPVPAAEPEPPPDTRTGWEKFGTAAKHGFMEGVHGVTDLGRRAIGLDPDAENAAEEARYQKTKPTGWQATVGDIAGGAAIRLPLALAAPEGLLAQMAIQGAAEAALTPGDLATRAKAAGMGAAGAGAGNLAMRGAGRVFKPIGDKAADTEALESLGVEPTFGQAMAQKGGAFGRAVGRAEEGALSVPIASGPLRRSRERAMEQWQQATREAAAPVGATAAETESVDAVRQAVGARYTAALNSERLPYQSVQYQPDMRRLSAGRPISNEQRDLVEQTFEQIRLKNMQNPTPGAQPTAAAAHSTESEMKALGARYQASMDPAQQDLGHLFNEVARDYANVWRNGLVDPRTRAAVDALDQRYPQFAAIRQAAKTVGSTVSEGDPNRYTPAVLSRAARTVDRTPFKTRYLRGEAPQQELARLGQTIQTKLPDSGTTERLLTGTGLLGGSHAAGIAPATIAAALALAAYGTRPAQQYLTGRLAPEFQQAMMQLLRRGAPGGAAVGAAAAPNNQGVPNAP